MIIFDIKAQDWMDWSVKTFQKADELASLEKCLEEISEIKDILKSDNIYPEHELASEYVDAIMCLLHSARRKGFDFEEISAAFSRKMRVNMRRTWKLNPNNTYSHI